MRSLLRRVWYLLRRRRAETDLDEELAFHRDMKTRELEEAGVEATEARREARRALGNTTLARDQVRDVWVPHWLQGVSQDFRFAVRTLAATPSVSGAAILSLALGIGANTAIFSLVDGLLLRDLPVRDPGRLVMLTDGSAQHRNFWRESVWQEIHARPQLFDGALAWAGARFDLAPSGESEYVNGVWVSGSYFGVLGIRPLLGRMISETDDELGGGPSGPAAVISYDFWQRHFNGDPSVIGRGFTLDRAAFTIVGVAPRGFFGTDVGHAFDVAVPLRDQPLTSHAGSAGGSTVSIMARLRPDQTIDSATVMLRAIQPEIRAATLPPGWPQTFLDRYLKTPLTLERAGTGVSALRERFARPLVAILIIVALVLLVACANLANLSLARVAARRRELGLRLALGASTWRVMRQLIAESVILGGAGAAVGLAVASWMASVLARQLSTTVSFNGPYTMTGVVFLDTSVDARLLSFTIVLTIVTLLVFGTVPAWRASRLAPLDAVVEHRRPGWRRRAWPATDVLIGIQVAISLVLIASASLLIRTLTALERRPLGFDRHGLVIATIDTQGASLSPEGRQALYSQVLDAARRLPDAVDASLSSRPPVVNGAMLGQPIQAVSGAAPLPPTGANAALNLIAPGWFQTMRIPVIAGRDIGPGDRLGAPEVAIVNQAFARTFLGGTNAVGHTVRLFLPGPPPPLVEIVGVVGDSVYGGLRSGIEPTIFLPIAQRSGVWLPFLSSVDLTIRARSGRVGSLEQSVAAEIASVNANVSLTLHPLSDYVNDSLVQERLVAVLSGGFAVLALALAAVGLYGVTAYAVTRRRTEIGVRLALGASAAHIIRITMSRLATLISVGVVIGAVVSLWTSRYLASLLYNVRPRDPVNLVSAVAVLLLAATLAAWAPLRAALRTDPASTIRCN